MAMFAFYCMKIGGYAAVFLFAVGAVLVAPAGAALPASCR
jgi:hypothetical protein